MTSRTLIDRIDAVLARLAPRRTNVRILLRRPMVFVRSYRAPLALLVTGGVLDAMTTYEAVYHLGPEVEVHPVQRIMFAMLGPGLGVSAAKLAQVGFAVLVASWWRPWCGWILAACGILYGLAAVSNHFGWLG